MDEPLVSIIMTAYRAEKYLPQALESVRVQTYVNWEIILVEDGSRDATEDILYDFAQRVATHRVSYLRHEFNRHCSAARNTGIKNAQGAYIAFLDCDDIWQPDHLRILMAALQDGGADVVYSKVRMFHEDGSQDPVLFGPTPEDLENFPTCLYGKNFIIVSAALVRKSALEKIGFFCEDKNIMDDWDCWIRLARAGSIFRYTDEITTLYRIHSGQVTNNPRAEWPRVAAMLRKHWDWNAVSAEDKRRAIADVYALLSLLYRVGSPAKSFLFSVQALLVEPYRGSRMREVLCSFLVVLRVLRR